MCTPVATVSDAFPVVLHTALTLLLQPDELCVEKIVGGDTTDTLFVGLMQN